ncbi:MAG: T9SS type A sorting domain-containing protein [Bacteroidota bacterium]
MRPFYTFLIIIGFNWLSYAQFHNFQLILVDSSIGSALFAGCEGCSNESNDEGLNIIFQDHNVGYYQNAYVYSSPSEDLMLAIYIGSCDSCDIDQLVADLNAYSGVILIASSYSIEDDYYFNHGLSLSLVDETIGVPIGEVSGVITTNNADLNQIFTDNNVSYYELVNVGTSYERFELFCNCDVIVLKQELDQLSAVVSSTELLPMIVLLSIHEEIEATTNIHPNPFKNRVSIEVNKPVGRIALYDILGKSIYESSSIRHFEEFSLTLQPGVYVLRLITITGESLTKKLIKS